MAMSRFEKLFVNRQSKGRRKSSKVRERLGSLDTEAIHDVLEIGCGFGTVSDYVAETYSMRVTGTDFDPEQISEAGKLYPGRENLHFQVEDAGAFLSTSTNGHNSHTQYCSTASIDLIAYGD